MRTNATPLVGLPTLSTIHQRITPLPLRRGMGEKKTHVNLIQP
jgi:hypothetical protein